MPDDADIGLHSLSPPRGSREAAQAGRPRAGLRLRQDLRARPEGRGRALGQQAQGRLRGRPDPAAHEDAEAPKPQLKKSMPFEPFRTHTQPVNLVDLNGFEDDAEVTPGDAAGTWARHAQAGAGEDPRTGRARAQEPGRVGTRDPRRGAGGDRGRGGYVYARRAQWEGDGLIATIPGASASRRSAARSSSHARSWRSTGWAPSSRSPASTWTRWRTSATASAAPTSSVS